MEKLAPDIFYYDFYELNPIYAYDLIKDTLDTVVLRFYSKLEGG